MGPTLPRFPYTWCPSKRSYTPYSNRPIWAKTNTRIALQIIDFRLKVRLYGTSILRDFSSTLAELYNQRQKIFVRVCEDLLTFKSPHAIFCNVRQAPSFFIRTAPLRTCELNVGKTSLSINLQVCFTADDLGALIYSVILTEVGLSNKQKLRRTLTKKNSKEQTNYILNVGLISLKI